MQVNRQKAQSVVEFALIIPLFLILIMGMIYGAFAYADYMQCTTSVREAARNIAMQTTAIKRQDKAEALKHDSYQPALYKAKLYQAEYTVDITEPTQTDIGYVVVSVTMTKHSNGNSESFIAKVLPEKLGPVTCTMPIEQEANNQNANGNS